MNWWSGMSKSKDNFELFEIIKVRFPPFESSLRSPDKLPMGSLRRKITKSTDIDDVRRIIESSRPEIQLGSPDSWFLERKFICTNNSEVIELPSTSDSGFIETKSNPDLINLQRKGWYLTPHSLHLFSRKIIPISVVLLLFSIIMHVFEPVLLSLNFFPEGLDNSVKLGLLDYPLLLVIVAPFVVAPLLMRVAANIIDLGRQRIFLSQSHPEPLVKLEGIPTSDENLVGNLSRIEELDWIEDVTIWWQVGLLSPSREMMLECHDSSADSQPPAGLSTPLPHYWVEGLSDGTDIGESTPIQSHDAPGGIFLPPLRIHAKIKLNQKIGDFVLEPPNGNWPGTQTGRIIRVHWELVVKLERSRGTPLYWVMPLTVKHGNGPYSVEKLPVQDGRLELTVN